MAVAIQDHIHLGTNNPPTTTYPALHKSLDWTPQVAVAFDRALTGKLHTHRLVSGADPIQFRSDRVRTKLTLAEMLVVKALAGKTLYYVFNYHDDNEDGAGSLKTWPTSDYVVRGVLMLRRGSVTNLYPKAAYWLMNIEIVDDDAVT